MVAQRTRRLGLTQPHVHIQTASFFCRNARCFYVKTAVRMKPAARSTNNTFTSNGFLLSCLVEYWLSRTEGVAGTKNMTRCEVICVHNAVPTLLSAHVGLP